MSKQRVKQTGLKVGYSKALIESASAESDYLLSNTLLVEGLTDKQAEDAHDWAMSAADHFELSKSSEYLYWLRYYFDTDQAEERG